MRLWREIERKFTEGPAAVRRLLGAGAPAAGTHVYNVKHKPLSLSGLLAAEQENLSRELGSTVSGNVGARAYTVSSIKRR